MAYYPPTQPAKGSTALKVVLIVFGFMAVGVFGLVACFAGFAISEAPPSVSSSDAADGGVGVMKVGTDIQPGEYKVTPTDEFGGYWARLSCTTGEFDCIIANATVDGPGYLTVLPTDVAVEVSRATITQEK